MLRSASYVAALGVLASFALASPSRAAVQGLYGTECLGMKGLSATKDMLFDAPKSHLETVQTVYADANCDTPAYDFSFSGPYGFDPATGFFDYTFEAIQLRVLDERIAQAFREIRLCGIDDWSVDLAHDVSGLDCAGTLMPAPGLKLFDILEEGPEGVQIGLATDGEDGLSSVNRPTEYDSHVYRAR